MKGGIAAPLTMATIGIGHAVSNGGNGAEGKDDTDGSSDRSSNSRGGGKDVSRNCRDNGDDGDGDGGKGERVFGSLKNRSQRALDSRSSFFANKEPYLLYLWDVAELHDLTRSCMQTLNANVAAGNGGKGVPLLFEDDDELSLVSM